VYLLRVVTIIVLKDSSTPKERFPETIERLLF